MLSGTSLSQPSKPVDALAGLAVLLEAGVVVAPLVVEHHDLARACRSPQSRGKTAACAVTEPLFMPDQMQSGAAGRPRGPVVQLPDLDAAGVVPLIHSR